ncbi:MAG: nucleotide pyrophosphohydrolase [Microbacteriaceae bacterium]
MSDTPQLLDITAIQQRLHEFADERDWHQFHDPKSLAMSVAIEAAELMECFQWLTRDEAFNAGTDSETQQAVAEEIADVAIYLLLLAAKCGIDVPAAIAEKIRRNVTRF